MTPQGVGNMCKIDGRMDAKLYSNTLQDDLLAVVEFYGWRGMSSSFNPKHTSQSARKWFQDNDINVLKWPAQPPDLNPIENLQFHLKRQLAAYEAPPAGIHELCQWVQVKWEQIQRRCV
jgi:hypothetical protein